jgi:ligand-binding sensor domain-containing protein
MKLDTMVLRGLSVIVGLVLTVGISAQNDIGDFYNYSINDGLSQSTVTQIYQDAKGFIWLGTTDGLNRFDGKNFTIYKNRHSNINSLSDSWIQQILLEDSENNLWIWTSDRAINKFNLRTNEFTRFVPNSPNPNAFSSIDVIYSMIEDKQKNIWFTTNKGIYKFLYPNYKLINYSRAFLLFKDNDLKVKICKDVRNVLWFPTTQGLYRYDDKSNKLIHYATAGVGLKGLLPGRVIASINDNRKQLWHLTFEGLSMYNVYADNFVSYPFMDIPINLKDARKYDLFADRKGNLWIATNLGLIRFDIQQKKYFLFTHLGNQSHSISDSQVTRLFESSKGELWVGTANGLNRYNPDHSTFDIFFQRPGSPADNFISRIFELHPGELWVLGSLDRNDGGFLSKVNTKGRYLENVVNNPCDKNSIASTYVFSPLVDKTRTLWLGSFGEGVIKYPPRISNFNHYQNITGNPSGYSSVWGFGEDTKGDIWIAGYDQGFSKFDTLKQLFTNYKPKVIINHKPANYSVMSVCPDRKGKVWVATMGAGLFLFDPITGITKNYDADIFNPGTISSNLIRIMTIDNTGKLLIANAMSGVDIFDPETGKMEKLKHDPFNKNSLPDNNIWYIFADKKNNLWISSNGYISYYNTHNKEFTIYPAGTNSKNGIPADKALSIYESSDGCVWFGTSGGGLSQFVPKTKTFITYTEEDGLANGVVYGITEDSKGCLWLSTNRGLSKFRPHEKFFKNFDESAGLQSNEFNSGAFFKSSANKMYFGGINGFNVFDPLNIVPDTIVPPTVLTGFQINNKAVPIVEPFMRRRLSPQSQNSLFVDSSWYYLPFNIAYMHSLALPYKVKVFTIEFAALLYHSPEKCTFRYKMEGFDEDWNYCGTRNYATYTNLPHGTYIFKVQSANPDGVWNTKAAEIQIIIVPPFWKTWWFVTLLFLSVLAIIWLFVIIREHNLRRSKLLLEERVKQRTKLIEEKNEELRLRNIEISRQKEEIDFQAKQLKTELAHYNQSSEIALLRSQVNPHFLFNTLNNIYSLVYQKSDDAPTAVMKLSEIMRYMLYDANTDKVPLEKEINYLKSFIELQVLRLKNRDCVDFTVTGTIYGKTIAPMLFIPFVENAFKHGNKRSENPCIIINLAINENHILFDIENQYQKNDPINKDKTGGIGLANVRRRLELLHPGTHKLEIENLDGKFHVTLDLTLHED